MICPKHNVELVGYKTKYGTRYTCTINKCTVVCWGGKTSTPADYETRKKRMEAHNAFDSLWKGQKSKRGFYYGKLSEYLELRQEQTHIGMFDIDKCEKVLQFVDNER